MLNAPHAFNVFEDAVTCSGASVPENVQKPPRVCTKVGGLTPIGPRFRGGQGGIFRRPWPLGSGPHQRRTRLKSSSYISMYANTAAAVKDGPEAYALCQRSKKLKNQIPLVQAA